MKWIASAAFGLEGQTMRDLKRLGAINAQTMNVGGATFEGDFAMGFAANLWLRTADRVLLVLAEFDARSFQDLFEGVKAIEWERYIPVDGAFPVRARCVRSQLMSESDTQSIVKKAVVERLKKTHRVEWFAETGATIAIDVHIRNDRATISLDSSGTPLSKRGYRTWNGEAPIRETLAAGLVLASGWHPWQPLIDPCCGTGTLLIEAAFIALARAPGLRRAFAMEQWPFVNRAELDAVRREAQSKCDSSANRQIRISGSDIDPEALELARRHVRQAGLEGRISLEQRDLRDLHPTGEAGVILANPPYGERLDTARAAHSIARQLGLLHARTPGWKMCVISADMGFERVFGQRATRRKRYYNGRIECEFRIFE